MAFRGSLDSASINAARLVREYPDYGDARILLARILAWQERYEPALSNIDTLLRSEPGNRDALDLKKDVKRWMGNSLNPQTEITAGYSFDSFNQPYTRFWQVFNAGASHNFIWGKGIAAINTGYLNNNVPSLISSAELQFEAEAYPKITRNNYAYIAYAFSPADHFPTHRAALEVWQELPAGLEFSAGLNYYRFDRDIFIAAVSANKYAGNFWFSGKLYLYFKDSGPTTSLYVNGRYYFNDKDYFQLTLGTGTAPDEPFDIEADLMRLSAKSIRIYLNKRINKRLALRIGSGFSSEEYAESFLRNRFEGSINISYSLYK